MKLAPCFTALALLVAPCAAAQEQSPFAQARGEVRTSIHYESSSPTPLPTPPEGVFTLVRYRSAVGDLGAYLTPDPGDGVRRPAIIWMTGGETNTVGDVWSEQRRLNDQSAAAYRQAGIVMMFPSLRGGNDNPGRIEGLFGEIDDILAARDFLATQPHVDPSRIYLGGHSTGGTLVFLTAAASDRFRAVFAFGPVARAANYGREFIPYDFRRLPAWEERLRAPAEWMSSVRTPLFVIEGTGFASNRDDFAALRDANTNPNIRFLQVRGGDHFSVLAPSNELIARAILTDPGPQAAINITIEELERAVLPTPQIRSGPRYLRRPNADQLRASYPPVALRDGVEGSAQVRCTIQSDGRLGQCEVLRETPPGQGFGAAAIQLAENHFLVETTLPDGVAAVGGTVTLPIRWFP